MAVSHTKPAPRRDWLLWGLGRRALYFLCIVYGTQMPKRNTANHHDRLGACMYGNPDKRRHPDQMDSVCRTNR